MDKLQIKVDLKGEEAKIFETFKSTNGFSTNAETLRHILHIASDAYIGQVYWNDGLTEEKIQAIKRFTNRPDVQNEYFVFSVSDFLQASVERLYNEIRSTRKSILHWNVKSSLPVEEKEIVLAFEACQLNNKNGEVTINDIANKLDRRNVKRIEEILDSFVNLNLLQVMTNDNKKVYHATFP